MKIDGLHSDMILLAALIRVEFALDDVCFTGEFFIVEFRLYLTDPAGE